VIAHLGMYPFEHLHSAYDGLWAFLAERIDGVPATLGRSIDLATAWRSPELLLGQTCGWPLVDQLADTVEVIGSFDVHAPFAANGRYRSVLVAAKPLSIAEWRAEPATVVAINGFDSLSGWVSLQWAWGGAPERTMETGAHVQSMRAVAEGRAHLASIDALSFEFLAEVEPATVGHLHIIGHGPIVPSLPLVMSKALASRRDEVRSALSAAMAAPELRQARERLRISGFVPLELSDFAGLRSLVPQPSR